MIDHFAAFIGIAVLVIVTPGPDTALVIRNGLAGGGRAGVYTSVGVVAGQAIWTLAASGGGVALLLASAPMLTAVKLVGAAYLVFVGLQALIGAVRTNETIAGAANAVPPRRITPAVAFRSGVMNNLANPKSALFFTSLLPQFVVPGGGSGLAFLSLGVVYCTITLFWLTSYSIVLARAGGPLRRPKLRRVLEGITGAALVTFGVRMAVEHSGTR